MNEFVRRSCFISAGRRTGACSSEYVMSDVLSASSLGIFQQPAEPTERISRVEVKGNT